MINTTCVNVLDSCLARFLMTLQLKWLRKTRIALAAHIAFGELIHVFHIAEMGPVQIELHALVAFIKVEDSHRTVDELYISILF